MPKPGVTVYELLVSCPSDVKTFLPIINEAVDNFNRFLGDTNNIRISLKHWASDTYPQSGNSPQELINSQLVDKCDALLAIFWSRFGTPTDKFSSGTEEEIVRVMDAKKQVFLYFLDKPISPSKVDATQYEKVIDFKKQYEGLYSEIKDEEDFKKLFMNHLALYFLNLLNPNYQNNNYRNLPNLVVRGIEDDSDVAVTTCKRNFSNDNYIKNKRKEIFELFEKVQQITVSSNKNSLREIPNYDTSDLETLDYEAKNDWKLTINNYFSKIGIEISYDFWEVGRFNPSEYFPVSRTQSAFGEPLLQEKSNSLHRLFRKINELNMLGDYLRLIGKKPTINCFVRNIGKSFDEDIEVKLIFPTHSIIQKSEIPRPPAEIVEEINDHYLSMLFFQNETVNVKSYKSLAPVNAPSIYFDEKQKFSISLDEIFSYKSLSEDGKDYLVFNIPYLKQNDNVFLPSLLLFHHKPKHFEYEIRSKHFPDVQYGKLTIKN